MDINGISVKLNQYGHNDIHNVYSIQTTTIYSDTEADDPELSRYVIYFNFI